MKEILRLAAGEVTRHVGRIDRRALIAFGIFGALTGLLLVSIPSFTPQPEKDFYHVTSHPDSPFREAALSESRLLVVEGDREHALQHADLYLAPDGSVQVRDTDRAQAALQVLDQAVRVWMDGRLRTEEDLDAAFPLEITLAYEARTVPAQPPAPPTPSPPPAPTEGPGAAPSPTPQPDILEGVEPVSEPRRALRPAQLDPPFPIRSLLLTFAYLIPGSMLAQVVAANLHAERTRHRGTLLLSTPLTPLRILMGRALPAAGVVVLLGASVTIALGAGILGFLASLSMLGFLLAMTLFLALLARTMRELSLLLVFATTALNVFLFLPAMFPSLPPVAFLSPVHVVASGIRGDTVALGPFLYGTVPLLLAGVGLGAMAVGLLREEILFSVRGMMRRAMDAVEAITRDRRRLLLAGLLVVPFVFAAELLVLVMAAVMGVRGILVAFLPGSVLIENVAKAFPAWARARRPLPGVDPVWQGLLVGTGFFVAEKGALVLTLVGFSSLPGGREALALLGTGPGTLLLLAPWALHVGTAMLSALGASKGRRGAVLGFLAAYIVHLAYDAALIWGALR